MGESGEKIMPPVDLENTEFLNYANANLMAPQSHYAFVWPVLMIIQLSCFVATIVVLWPDRYANNASYDAARGIAGICQSVVLLISACFLSSFVIKPGRQHKKVYVWSMTLVPMVELLVLAARL